MSYCEIVLVRHSEDAMGYPCGAISNEECSECGTSVCTLHAESCDLCGQTLCASCFFQHMAAPHSKRPASIPSANPHNNEEKRQA